MTDQLRNSLPSRTRGRRRITCAFALMVLASLIGTSVEAGERHAKLSQDLEQQLASGSSGRTSVILDPSAIASRHGLQIKKRLERSEVVEVTPEQLAALANDPTISHLSGDARVQGMLTTAVMATGADQVWGGISGLPGYTGRGVGVAVLDSGCSNHASIRKSVIASFDFTNSKTGLDEYGHGTFVASIIAGQDDQYSRDCSRVAHRLPEGARRHRLRRHQRRHRRPRLPGRERRAVQHRRHQYVTRPPGVRVVPRRSTGPGR